MFKNAYRAIITSAEVHHLLVFYWMEVTPLHSFGCAQLFMHAACNAMCLNIAENCKSWKMASCICICQLISESSNTLMMLENKHNT